MEKLDILWQAISPGSPIPGDYNNIEFWVDPEREGWLSKKGGEYLRTWRRRWFIVKQGKMVWFKHPSHVNQNALPRGVLHLDRCKAVRYAEDEIKKPCSFVVNVDGCRTYFVAESDTEKQQWVSSIGRVIAQKNGVVIPENDY